MTDKTSTALVDCDGVLCDFSRKVAEVAGIEQSAITQWDFAKCMTEAQAERVYDALFDPATWMSMHPTPWAKELIAWLEESHYRVVVVTSPWWMNTETHCMGWSETRLIWLTMKLGIPAQDVIMTKDKSLIEGDVFIDDRPSNVEAWKKERVLPQAWLWDAPYNRDSDLPRINARSVESRVPLWRGDDR